MWVHFTSAIGHHVTKIMQSADLGKFVIKDTPEALNAVHQSSLYLENLA